MLVEERSAAIEVPQAPSGTALAGARAHGGLLLVAVCVALAALTLLLPSAPTYDPWSWIIWGREIAHLDLVTTGGPSWKPLPVLFTTVFSLFGSWAPDLWLVVARAGAIAAVVLAFRVSRRLGGGIVGGVAAAAALAIAPWWIRNAALGNSEGLIVAFLLATIDRHLAGDRRAAFLLAVCAGLLRPEAWPFLGLYGLWLLWRRELPARLIVGAGAGVVALWLLPEWWGSGDLLRAAHRAKDVNPGAPTYADSPVRAVLEDASEMLTAPLVAGLVAAVAHGGRAPRPRGGVPRRPGDLLARARRLHDLGRLLGQPALPDRAGRAADRPRRRGRGLGAGADHRPRGPGRARAGAQAPGARARGRRGRG